MIKKNGSFSQSHSFEKSYSRYGSCGTTAVAEKCTATTKKLLIYGLVAIGILRLLWTFKYWMSSLQNVKHAQQSMSNLLCSAFAPVEISNFNVRHSLATLSWTFFQSSIPSSTIKTLRSIPGAETTERLSWFFFFVFL